MSNPIQTLKRNSLSLSIATALGGLALISTGAQAAAPAAGTNISNIATATYTDGSTTRTVTSNEVKTTVTQVGSFRLVQDVTTSANQNSEVQFQHTLYNDGNGTDTFKIDLTNLTGDSWDFKDIKVFLDADGDGKADSNTPLTLGASGTDVTVVAGGKVNLIVVATTAGAVSNATAGKLELSATSKIISADTTATAADKTKTNTDTATITAGAVFAVEKKASVNEVNVKTAAQKILYTLSYRNKGNDKGDLIIDDTLNANLVFRPTGTNDANFADHVVKLNGSVLAYVATPTGAETASYYTYDSGAKKLRFVIKNVERNTDGNITFEADVKAGTAPGTVPNTAMYDSDGPDPSGKIVPDVPTNNTEIKVLSTNTGVINDSETKTDKTGNDDTITVASVAQGSSVKFGSGTENTGLEVIYVHNNGDTTDTFTVELDALSNLPVGTTVTFLQPNGTPLTSTVGNAKDTGPIAVGGSYQLVAVVNLPPEFSGTQVNGKDIQAVVKITSTKDASQTDPITLKILNITKNSVDLSNGKGNKDGKDDAGEKTGEGQNTSYTVDKITANPGQTVTFPVAVTNHGSSTDNYNLTTDLPSDWKVEFFEADSTGTCTGTAPISNTGDVEPGAAQTKYFCAKVTPPANAPAGDKDITFTVSSVATKLSDTMKDQVVVNAVRNLTLVTGQESSVAPGGTITYEHTLTNVGNVTEGSVAGTLYLDITQDDTTTGFTTTVYVDSNGNGVLDATDAVLTAAKNDLGAALAGLTQGESVKLWVKVQAPSTATNGLVDVSTIKVYADGDIATIKPSGAVSNQDRTTVTAGQIRLEKTQALQMKCTGNIGTFGTATLEAKPGDCIVYQIKAINDGKAEVTNVQITDAVPAYTTGTLPTVNTNVAFVPASTETPAPTYKLDGKQLSVTPFKLQPNQNATLQFTVEVDK
jgi:trimeric autotransporter adhesin